MDRSGQLPDLPFQPSGPAPWEIEVLDLTTVFADTGIARIGPHRSDFHVLFRVTRGTGAHHVDFVERPYHPGTVLWTRPGVVHRFRPNPEIGGAAVLFTGLAPADGQVVRDLLRPSARCTTWRLPPADAAVVDGLVSALRSAAPAHGSPRYALSALLLHLAALTPEDPEPPGRTGEIVRAFEILVERRYRERLTTQQAAAALDWSARTLSRACLAGRGRTPKDLIDARVLLEARRLLVNTDHTVAEISRHLGFTDPSAFGLFFRRLDGHTPGAFRHR
ncbi:helix-turn-helix domain-containing protein [Dactylosporangium sp. CA-233914]|uniref:AraC family transcriptional regulator n=1 Tax=Dactylosporangium sp. CA-233914 TaxID=3239934 RepID=UPI003D8AA58A